MKPGRQEVRSFSTGRNRVNSNCTVLSQLQTGNLLHYKTNNQNFEEFSRVRSGMGRGGGDENREPLPTLTIKNSCTHLTTYADKAKSSILHR